MTSWCKGCFMHKAYNVLSEYLKTNPTILISGIGCAGRITSFTENKKQNIHTLHGRACAVASGISNFEKTIVFSGDGDLLDIGLSHTIHAKERNDNIRVVCMNNGVYAMTGRQKRTNKVELMEYLVTEEINIFDKEFKEKFNNFLNGTGFGLLLIAFKCLKE